MMNEFQNDTPMRLRSKSYPQKRHLKIKTRNRSKSYSHSPYARPNDKVPAYKTPSSPTSSEDEEPKSFSRKKKRICRRWTTEENDRLMKAYYKHNGKNWNAIAKEVRTKTSDSCNQHWHRVLDPTITKEPWNAEEDKILINKVLEIGTSSWKKVSLFLEGRTDLQCRHRWNRLDRENKEKSEESLSDMDGSELSNNDIDVKFQGLNISDQMDQRNQICPTNVQTPVISWNAMSFEYPCDQMEMCEDADGYVSGTIMNLPTHVETHPMFPFMMITSPFMIPMNTDLSVGGL